MRIERLYLDLLILSVSIVFTILFVHSGYLDVLLNGMGHGVVLESFIAGVFFTSVFTIAPASVVLGELSLHADPLLVALIGGIGAMFGDLALFLFVRDVFTADLKSFAKRHFKRRILRYFHFGFMRWLSPFLGALIIASPLPDELGLALMGMSKVRMVVFLPLTFVLNVIGILIIGSIARSF